MVPMSLLPAMPPLLCTSCSKLFNAPCRRSTVFLTHSQSLPMPIAVLLHATAYSRCPRVPSYCNSHFVSAQQSVVGLNNAGPHRPTVGTHAGVSLPSHIPL